MKKIKISYYFYVAIALVLIQQIILAFSNVFLANLAKNVVLFNKRDIYTNFYLFFLFVGLSYIPWIYSNVYLTKGIYGSFVETIKKLAFKNFGNIDKWSNIEEKKTFSSWLSKELFIFYEHVGYTIFQFVAILSNIIFSVVAISFLLDYKLAFGYLLSITLSYVVFKIAKQKLAEKANLAQVFRNKLDGILYLFWDSVLLGNEVHYKSWLETLTKKSAIFVNSESSKTHFHQIIITVATYIAYIPIFSILLYQLDSNINNVAFLAALSVLLVRNLSVLNEINGLIELKSFLIDLTVRKKNIDMALDTLSIIDDEVLNLRLDFKKISLVFNGKIINRLELDEYVKSKLPGRITISGVNGSGKTTLLLMIKKYLSKGAIYIPPDIDISIEKNESTGEKKIRIIEESIKSAINYGRVLLLDEWNANLDSVAAKKIVKKLECFSDKNLLIEIIHK